MENLKTRKTYVEKFFDREELKKMDIEQCGSYYTEDGDFDFFDEDELIETINCLVKNSNHYLVMLFGARWTGANGYKFATEKTDCFYRDYECSQYVTGASVGGKVLELREHHHDVPMGHRSLIIALTDTEYSKLENADFETVETFAYSQMEKVEKF